MAVVCVGPLELVVYPAELVVGSLELDEVLDAAACVVSSEFDAIVCVIVSALLVTVVSCDPLETEPLFVVAVLVVDSPNTAELVVAIVFNRPEEMLLETDVGNPLLLSVEENEGGPSVVLSIVEVELADSIVFDGPDEVLFRTDV